jgi:tetratricopeptide (TPR) repeat protein
MGTSLKLMSRQAARLKEAGKLDEAIALYSKAARNYPNSAVAEHNLAAVLGDAGRAADAETHIRRAFAKGLNAAESWLVLARALLAQGKLDEARAAFDKTLEINSGLRDAHYELAQLIWMSTGDSGMALAPLEAMIRSHPGSVDLYTTKVRIMMYTEGYGAAYRFAAESLRRWPNDVRLLAVASDAATMAEEAEAALSITDRLLQLRPFNRSVQELRIGALFLAGQPEAALPIAKAMRDADPDDQHALCLLATAWRLVGDSRYRELYDYAGLVRPYRLGVPEGWASLSEYLRDLSAALRERHLFKTHPFSNSEEGGSKIADLLELPDPTIRAFRQALQPAVDAHLRHLGTGTDPLRRRNTGRWKIDGIWSVWLRPHGFHHNHTHPQAWLSSASYIELPDEVAAEGRAGWIKFGEPGLPTRPRLSFEHAVKPEPGMLVLFPSYMWHGTIPFVTGDSRLTIAFDIVPD